MKKKFFPILILLLLFTLVNQLLFSNSKQKIEKKPNEIQLFSDQNSYQVGKEVNLKIINNLNSDISLTLNCQGPFLNVYKLEGQNWRLQLFPRDDLNLNCKAQTIVLKSSEESNISLKNWKHRLFGEIGQYQIRHPVIVNQQEQELVSNIFTISARSFLGKIWDEGLYRPIYNSLTNIFPFKSLAIGIILLTLIIRFILYFPSKKALHSQKKLQDIQPKLKEIQHKYKGNQERIALETMKLWKENKVNPFGSCLPILIQMPVLIALFYVIQDGLNPDNINLLYQPIQNIKLTEINPIFLGILNLTKNNTLFLPIIIGGLQFFQMKLSLPKKNESKQLVNQKETNPKANELVMMNNMMLYFMPIMIAIFTASLPSGVGLYWGVSTIFSIGQQVLINREKSKDEPKIKVVYDGAISHKP